MIRVVMPSAKQTRKLWAIALYAGILLAVRVGMAQSGMAASLGAHFRPALLSFALLLAPLWFFGFRLDEWLAQQLRPSWALAVFSTLLGVPYLVFAIPTGNLRWVMMFSIFLLPVILVVLESTSASLKFVWQDAVVLGTLSLIYLLRLLTSAWPYAGLSVLPKLYVADLALYLYLVVRKLGGVGYSFSPKLSAFLVGLREWVYFLPIGIGLGAALRFIHFHARVPSGLDFLSEVLATFLLVAVPEEVFFRGILQNLLET